MPTLRLRGYYIAIVTLAFGEIIRVFSGRYITHDLPDVITRLRVARTFQNIRLLGAMTALENVVVGRHCRMRAGIGRAPARRRSQDRR